MNNSVHSNKYFNVANLYYQHEEYEKALDCYHKVVKGDDGYVERIYQKMEKIREIQDYNQQDSNSSIPLSFDDNQGLNIDPAETPLVGKDA